MINPNRITQSDETPGLSTEMGKEKSTVQLLIAAGFATMMLGTVLLFGSKSSVGGAAILLGGLVTFAGALRAWFGRSRSR